MNILCFICAVPTTTCILLAINGFFFNQGKVLTDQCAWLPLHSCFFVTIQPYTIVYWANFHIILFYNTGLLEQRMFLKILFLFLFSVMAWQFLSLGKQNWDIRSVSENNLIRYEAGRHFYFEFYNKIAQILSLGDEAGDYFSVYLMKSIWGREVFYSLLLKFQMRHEGFWFYWLRKSD